MSLLPPLRPGLGRPLYAGLTNRAKLETPVGPICLIPRRPHNKFGDGMAEHLSYLYGVHPQTLIQCNEATCHRIMTSSLWEGGGGGSYPVYQIGNNKHELLQCTPKEKEPIPQLNHHLRCSVTKLHATR